MISSHFQVVLLLLVVATTTAGFLSCLILYRYTKFRGSRTRPLAMRCVYQWGMAFFMGVSILSIDWAMGDKAPLQITPLSEESGRIGFANLALCWGLLCLSGFMVQRVVRVIVRPTATPEGWQLQHARTVDTAARRDGQVGETPAKLRIAR
jgi:hypothetical protein